MVGRCSLTTKGQAGLSSLPIKGRRGWLKCCDVVPDDAHNGRNMLHDVKFAAGSILDVVFIVASSDGIRRLSIYMTLSVCCCH